MAQIINTNVAALNTQRQLNKSQTAMQTNLQRLSSGMRINSAKDDAAGLAISNRMISQIQGLNQASRNANDGISLAQTAEGALDEVTNALQRMRTLAVQAANDTNSDSDRLAIQAEVRQLVDEINRIGNTTQFNGKNVLDGSDAVFNFHIGANAGQNLVVTMEDMRASALGQQPGQVQTFGHRIDVGGGVNAGVAPSGVIADDPDFITSGGTDYTITIAGYNPVGIADMRYGGNIGLFGDDVLTDPNDLNYGAGIAKDIAARINHIREMHVQDTSGNVVLEGVYATAETRFTVLSADSTDLGSDGSIGPAFSHVAGGEIRHEALKINGVNVGPAVFQKNDADGSLVNAINSKSNLTGVTASINKDGALEFYAADGRDIIIQTDDGDPPAVAGSVANLLFAGGGSAVHNDPDANFTGEVGLRVTGSVKVSADQTITMGTDLTDLGFDPNATTANGEQARLNAQAVGSIQNADVTTVEGANRLMSSVDSALEQVDGLRAKLGAVQNRFEMTIRNLDNVSENLSAANSRIRDADFAAETTAMTRNQILQQAGTAMLSQANAQAQNVMSLLQ